MKQIELCFEVEKNFIPIQYHSLMLSFIKGSVQGYSPELFSEWFGPGGTVRKSYTFSCFFPSAKFEKERILLGENYFKMFFSTHDLRDLLLFYNVFLQRVNGSFPMAANTFTLRSLYTPSVAEIQKSQVMVKFDSPLLVRFHDKEANRDTFLAYFDERFADVLKENLAVTL